MDLPGMVPFQGDGTGMGGLGLTLIASFVQQMNGRVEHDDVEKESRTRVYFPLAS
jgi:signal transduction histidine kinase